MKKLFSILLVTIICFISMNTIGYAANPCPAGIDQDHYNRDVNMTLEQLTNGAFPLPADIAYKFVNNYGGFSGQLMPKDGIIYYIDNYRGTAGNTMYYDYLGRIIENGIYKYFGYQWLVSNGKLIGGSIKQDDVPRGSDDDMTKNMPITVKRSSGSTRYETAVQIAEDTFNSTGQKVDSVILTTGENFPDALAGSVLAKKINAPILLVSGSGDDNLPAESYISQYLNANGNIYILGGAGVVSTNIEVEYKSKGYNVVRIEGADRYATCVNIANELNVVPGAPVVIATGNDFPDALSISSVAAVKGYPILLVDKDNIPDVILNSLKTINPSKIYIAGGPGVVADSVENTLRGICTSVVRLSGSDRYKTSLAIAGSPELNMTGDTVCIATGINFPDALSGSIYAAVNNAPIILVDDDNYTEQLNFIDGAMMYQNRRIFGGLGAVSQTVENAFSK